MAENDPIPTPQVQDKRVKPSGVLPKNAQAWVLSGLALLMVAVIALSGRTPSKERGSPALPATAGVMDPNAARIQEYQTRIEEQARKLQLEQAQLARTQQTLTPGAATGALYPGQTQSGPYMRPGEPRYASPEPDPVVSSIQADKEKRAYQSLFASNVALSYRRENSAERSPLTAETASTPQGVSRPELLPSNSDGINGTRFLVERPNQEKGESVSKPEFRNPMPTLTRRKEKRTGSLKEQCLKPY